MSGRVFAHTFGRVPTWLLDAAVSDRAIRLFALLTRYADREGRGFPGRRALAERLRCSVDSIDRALRELVDVGAVRVEERWDVAGDGGRLTNDYHLLEQRAEGRSRVDAAAPDRTGAAPLSRRVAAVPAAPLRLQREREPEEREPQVNETPPFIPRWGRGEVVPGGIHQSADDIVRVWAAAYRDRIGHGPTTRAVRQLTREARRLLAEGRPAPVVREAAVLLVVDTVGPRLLECRVDRVLMGHDGRPRAPLTGQLNPIDARIRASVQRAAETAG
jgi:hypothetical protein